MLSLICVLGLAAGNAHNDTYDAEADKKTPHKAWRPIPSGVIHPGSAMNAAYFMYGMIVIIALTLSFLVAVVTIWYVFLLHLYNEKARQEWGLGGHIVASLLTTATVILPMAYVGSLALFPLALGLFLLEVGREIIVSIPDTDEGVNTLPNQIGVEKAARLSRVYTLGWCLIFPIQPLLTLAIGELYLLTGALWGVCLFLAPLYAKEKEKPRVWIKFQVLTKIPMVVFVVALLVEVWL